jgi:excisionase family DNA binding protein
MHTNVKQIKLPDRSAALESSRAMYHETITEPLEKQTDISYLFRQLDENEFLGAMKTKRIIRYSHRPDHTAVETFSFREEISLPSTMGRVEELIPESAKPKMSHTVEQIQPIISQAGILMISQQLDPHDIVVIPAPAKHRLSDIVIDSSCSMNLLLGRSELLYWFTMGHSGIFKMTAKVITDEDNFLAKLKANLDDVPMREYLVQRSLAGSKTTLDYIDKVPDRMGTEEAAAYLGMSVSTLYKQVEAGKIECSKPGGQKLLFLKTDLDEIIRKKRKRKPRKF